MSYAHALQSLWFGSLSLIPAPPPDRLRRSERLFLLERAHVKAFRRWQTWIGLLNVCLWLPGVEFYTRSKFALLFGWPLEHPAGLVSLILAFLAFEVIVATAAAASLWKEVLESGSANQSLQTDG